MTHRFFVPKDFVSEECVRFTTDQARQMQKVIRLRPGDYVSALDNTGREFSVRIEQLDNAKAIGKIESISCPDVEPKAHVTLVQSMPKGEKIDLILQKCTEIGVSKFLITETTRSVAKLNSDKKRRKLERWEAIIREAAEQSGRTRIPEIGEIKGFLEIAAEAKFYDKAFIAWKKQKNRSLVSESKNLDGAKRILLFIGPEGGFTDEEADLAKTSGFIQVCLGARILRTETAAIVGAALIIYNIES